jgi:hypothetical protein
MTDLRAYIILLIAFVALSSCAVNSTRKSASYYETNKDQITQIRRNYEALYSHQPFSVGFTDKSFKYYVMEVTTDTVRYIFNTEQSETKLLETIQRFRYDTAQLRQLAREMKEIKCLWLDKSSFYLDGVKESVTFLSFKSVTIDKPFVRINDLVYFMIGNRFR